MATEEKITRQERRQTRKDNRRKMRLHGRGMKDLWARINKK